ncbi:FAD-dependent monooxygenase [Actinomadura formosensis]|uniref:FAD-dependent monooxygenase n=1 Tax=Actinomadura formosensis TaxID=60706 RepID=UPI000835CF4D|nr:FAD-dependent monooxygenase [Actinomadura formosensis]
MTEIKTDVCIVGGGPGGLALALALVRSGVRVTVLERSRSFERDYRGEILQPGGLAVLDELGVLAGARDRGCHVHGRFQLVERGSVLLDINYGRLPEPFGYLLSIPQKHVLEELLAHCRAYEGFEYIAGAKVTRLITHEDTVVGACAEDTTVLAHCVVGADGRFSKVRRLAGIEADRIDAFDFDVLWFKLPDPGSGADVPNVQIFRDSGSPVIVYRSWPGNLQIGWTLPHRGYRDIAARGIEAVRAEIARAVPAYAAQVEAGVRTPRDLTLLDVFAGGARTWVKNGLVLIGDAAHTHGPLGAQGINLALQDAALLHPVLLASLRAGDPGAPFLRRYEDERRPDIETVTRMQVMQAKGMISQGGLAARLRPRIAKVITRTPIGAKITRRIAFGPRPVRVRRDLFTARTQTTE